MRKFIIKHFLLTKRKDVALGVSNILLITIAGLLLTYTGSSIFTATAFAAMLTLLFFTFVYFRIFPVKWEELNDEQKWNYGWAIQNGKSSKISALTKEQQEEWDILNARYN